MNSTDYSSKGSTVGIVVGILMYLYIYAVDMYRRAQRNPARYILEREPAHIRGRHGLGLRAGGVCLVRDAV